MRRHSDRIVAEKEATCRRICPRASVGTIMIDRKHVAAAAHAYHRMSVARPTDTGRPWHRRAGDPEAGAAAARRQLQAARRVQPPADGGPADRPASSPRPAAITAPPSPMPRAASASPPRSSSRPPRRRQGRPHRQLWRACGAGRRDLCRGAGRLPRAPGRKPARWRSMPMTTKTVLAGQGTVGREFEQDAPDLTHVLVATGGGGLIGGIAAWYAGSVRDHQRRAGGLPRPARRVACRPAGQRPGRWSGRRQPGRAPGRRADVPDRQHFVAQAVLVTDEAILAAQRLLWDRFRLVAEPGGATAAAALLSGRFRPAARRPRRRGGLRCQHRSGQARRNHGNVTDLGCPVGISAGRRSRGGEAPAFRQPDPIALETSMPRPPMPDVQRQLGGRSDARLRMPRLRPAGPRL